jgi:hypothetical protein
MAQPLKFALQKALIACGEAREETAKELAEHGYRPMIRLYLPSVIFSRSTVGLASPTG